MWLELDHIKHPLPRAIRRSSPKSRKGWHGCCLIASWLGMFVCHLPSCGLCAMGRWGGALKFFEAVVQARHAGIGSGLPGPDESDLACMVTKRLGAAHLCWLGRCLVSLVLRLMAGYSPNDPLRCGSNSTTSHTRCFVLRRRSSPVPARVWHGCCLATS